EVVSTGGWGGSESIREEGIPMSRVEGAIGILRLEKKEQKGTTVSRTNGVMRAGGRGSWKAEEGDKVMGTYGKLET
ncbi:hypothetical protein HAX54_043427, partial [Datura stramonium]|nr:hypothetical protein [Datura stramonium]